MFKFVILLALVAFATAYPKTSTTTTTTTTTPKYGLGPTSAKPGAPKVAQPPTPSGPVNPFNLTFVVSARNLPSKKKNTKPDVYIVVSSRKGPTPPPPAATDAKDKKATKDKVEELTLIGQTDVLKSNDNPDYYKVFSFIWTKGNNQYWRFEVKGKHTLSKDDDLGAIDVNIDEYVLQKNQDLTIPLKEGGSLIIKKTIPVNFRLYARNIPKLDTLGGASDPYVECFWRKGKDGNDTQFYTTKTVDDVENADWDETIEFANYQKGADMYWHFKVQDKDSITGSDFVGETLVEIDPFVQKRAAKVAKLSTEPTNKATLTITPA